MGRRRHQQYGWVKDAEWKGDLERRIKELQDALTAGAAGGGAGAAK